MRCVDERTVLIAARGARPIVRVESGRPDRSIRTNNLERMGTGTLVRGIDPKATPSEVLKRVSRASRSTWRDVYAGQMLGPAAAMIPFIAHDDGARAMMGAKNMKQAVPLDEPEAPWIATGFERIAAEALGLVIRATRAGSVTAVGSNGISVTTTARTGRRVRPSGAAGQPEAGVGQVQVSRSSGSVGRAWPDSRRR